MDNVVRPNREWIQFRGAWGCSAVCFNRKTGIPASVWFGLLLTGIPIAGTRASWSAKPGSCSWAGFWMGQDCLPFNAEGKTQLCCRSSRPWSCFMDLCPSLPSNQGHPFWNEENYSFWFWMMHLQVWFFVAVIASIKAALFWARGLTLLTWKVLEYSWSLDAFCFVKT